ncbi:ribonuclease domain-containing protein [Tsukamurella ocularis]|uniref:ribonuclease domain-containing protein n=1 Tax=Tsukamurella ocularis TaxID=1970234 RepID=UPI00216723E6|nr:ribonuclease domain-containing protein [Tsukamurella ocularis]MCS3778399.1 guanyl-specific ribonuclease Sa [Tsukamurella ocularis]MCS3789100.1 guanyl-specific ribonuclease Sa [Tsukamurella ocularis]MCS3852951.1 guanyl-specific ribonuclease Sa [Tsukamurella ocularis]
MRRILALCAIALLTVFGLVACGKTTAEPSATATPAAASTAGASGGGARASAPSNSAAPARVLATLARIDAGTWPPKDGSGTQGGRNFGNFEGRLPANDKQGKRAKYTEWDVNVKKSGRGRDAERIITGADGGAWFTLDHYETFTRIR